MKKKIKCIHTTERNVVKAKVLNAQMSKTWPTLACKFILSLAK